MYTPQNDALKMYFIEYYTAPKDFGGLFFLKVIVTGYYTLMKTWM